MIPLRIFSSENFLDVLSLESFPAHNGRRTVWLKKKDQRRSFRALITITVTANCYGSDGFQLKEERNMADDTDRHYFYDKARCFILQMTCRPNKARLSLSLISIFFPPLKSFSYISDTARKMCIRTRLSEKSHVWNRS